MYFECVSNPPHVVSSRAPQLFLNPRDMGAHGYVAGELMSIEQCDSLGRPRRSSTLGYLPVVLPAVVWPLVSLTRRRAAHNVSLPTLRETNHRYLTAQTVFSIGQSHAPLIASLSLYVSSCFYNLEAQVAAPHLSRVVSHLKTGIVGSVVAVGTYLKCRLSCGQEFHAQIASLRILPGGSVFDKESCTPHSTVPEIGRVHAGTSLIVTVFPDPSRHAKLTPSCRGATLRGIPGVGTKWYVHFLGANRCKCVQRLLTLYSGDYALDEDTRQQRACANIHETLATTCMRIDCMTIFAMGIIDGIAVDAELLRISQYVASTSPSLLVLVNLDVISLYACTNNPMTEPVKRAITTITAFIKSLHQVCLTFIVSHSTNIDQGDIQICVDGKVEFESLDKENQQSVLLNLILNSTTRRHMISIDLFRPVSASNFAGDKSRARSIYLSMLKGIVKQFEHRVSFRRLFWTLDNTPIETAQFWESFGLTESANAVSKATGVATRWHDVGGLKGVKQVLREVLEWPTSVSAANSCMGVALTRGILLYGPPGCSKTMLARAVATESGREFLDVQGPALLSKWLGESERAVRDLFQKARAVAPSVVFFDEIDALTMRRASESGANVESAATNRVLAQLLTEFDGVHAQAEILIVAATNRPDLIDPALLRPGRFDRLIYVPPPDPACCGEILQLALMNAPVDPHLDGSSLHTIALKASLAMYSGAELIAIARRAALLALEECAEFICECHLERALLHTRPTATPAMISFYEKWASFSLKLGQQ